MVHDVTLTPATAALRKQWGKRLREIREERRMSQAFLAEQIGINPSSVHRAETGQSVLDDDNRLKAATALGVQVSDIWAYPDTGAS